MLAATLLSSCKPAAFVPQQRRASRPAATAPRRAQVVTRASVTPAEVLQLAADVAPGSVDAPIGYIVLGAAVVTVLSFAVSLGLKSGTDAAIDMQARDKKKFNKRD